MNCTNEKTQIANDGDYHVIRLIADGCKLIGGFYYYDEKTGLKQNPNIKIKRFFTDEQVNELERCIVTAMNLRSELDRRKLLRRAKEIISQALGEKPTGDL